MSSKEISNRMLENYTFLVFGFGLFQKQKQKICFFPMKIIVAFVWVIIYFCTMDGFFRILEKTSSEVLLSPCFTPLFVSSHSVIKSYLCYFIRCSFNNYWILPIFPFCIDTKNLVWSCLFFAFPYLTAVHFMQQTDWYRNSDKETQFELWRFKVEQKTFIQSFTFL